MSRLQPAQVERLIVHINMALGHPANSTGYQIDPQTGRGTAIPGALAFGGDISGWTIDQICADGHGSERVFGHDDLRSCFNFLKGISWLLYQQQKAREHETE